MKSLPEIYQWIPFNKVLADKFPKGKAVHFYTDDYQFERFWRQPEHFESKEQVVGMKKALEDALTKVAEIKNATIADAFVKADVMLETSKHPLCSVSGGADSDIVVDIITKLDTDKKVNYVWINTGLEYQATKDHLQELQNKYNIEIQELKPVKSIPTCCREDGQPFVSKYVSGQIKSLQKYKFEWDADLTYTELLEKYKGVPISLLKWWANEYQPAISNYNVARQKWLKEFLINNPPEFKVSNKCCTYAKKNPIRKYVRENNIDMDIMGIRKAEGGVRALERSCTTKFSGLDVTLYRPIFWFKDSDKKEYEELFDVTHSACYTKYGLKRTGCVGCPYNRNFFEDMESIKENEPKLWKAATTIFEDSYKYTLAFKEFKKEMKEKEKAAKQGISQIKLNLN